MILNKICFKHVLIQFCFSLFVSNSLMLLPCSLNLGTEFCSFSLFFASVSLSFLLFLFFFFFILHSHFSSLSFSVFILFPPFLLSSFYLDFFCLSACLSVCLPSCLH